MEPEQDLSPSLGVTKLCDLADEVLQRMVAAAKCEDMEARLRILDEYTNIMAALSDAVPLDLRECGLMCSVAGSLMKSRTEGGNIGNGNNEKKMLATCYANYVLYLCQEIQVGAERQTATLDYAVALQHRGSNDNGAGFPAS